MALTKPALIKLKRDLIEARSLVQQAAADARRANDINLAERLRDIVDQIGNELDYIHHCLTQQP